jgi:Flp pilus assembly protein TadG
MKHLTESRILRRLFRLVLLRHSARDESGSAVIELALIVSFLGIPLLVGTADIGTAVYASIEINNAAEAGSAYGMQSSTFAANTSGITSAAQAEATDFGTALTVTPTVYYACSTAITGTQYTTQSAAESACTGGANHALEFIQVKTSATVTPKIHLPALASSFTVTGQSVKEVEQ